MAWRYGRVHKSLDPDRRSKAGPLAKWCKLLRCGVSFVQQSTSGQNRLRAKSTTIRCLVDVAAGLGGRIFSLPGEDTRIFTNIPWHAGFRHGDRSRESRKRVLRSWVVGDTRRATDTESAFGRIPYSNFLLDARFQLRICPHRAGCLLASFPLQTHESQR